MRQNALVPRRHGLIVAAGPALGALVALSLAGCATGSVVTAASAESIAEYANGAGISADLVYTTDVEGYDLAPQSVGPGAAEGMSATWFNQTTGAMLTIRTDSGDMAAASCVETPVWDAPDEAVTCRDEGGVWHRSAGSVQEYVVVRDGALIRVNGTGGAAPSDLLAAAKAVHVPSEAELDRLFSDLPDAPGVPVERGDLPENGDGAPTDRSGPGG